jgi:hypothetical protein
MNKAMENLKLVNLKWVAYDEYVSKDDDESDEELGKVNDISESSETDDKTDEDVSARSCKVDGSESAESDGEG